MKQWFRTAALLLAAAGILTVTAAAYEVPSEFEAQTIEDAMAEFMAAYGLNEWNFSLSYFNTVTGEAYTYNDGAFMVAGSTYKLPLNMYYYELERDGELASDAYISGAGMTLDSAHYQSLVYSNNDVSIGLLYNLGDFRTYKTLMRKYFTMTDEEIDPSYYTANNYCTRMMMDALTYLYDHSEDFEEMLGYMDEAQPGEYFELYVKDYAVAHKYGWFEGAVNDVGIIYTPQPFLLAVYTQDVNGTEVLGRAAELFTNYTLWQEAQQAAEEAAAEEPEEPPEDALDLEITRLSPEAEPEEEPEAAPAAAAPIAEPEPAEAPSTEPDPLPEPEPEAQSAFAWWMIPIALGVFLLGGGVTVLITASARHGKYERRYRDRVGKK